MNRPSRPILNAIGLGSVPESQDRGLINIAFLRPCAGNRGSLKSADRNLTTVLEMVRDRPFYAGDRR